MGAAVRIAVKDLRLRVRDRSAFIIGLVAPLALAFIFDAVFGSALGAGSLGLEYGIVDRDASEISSVITEALEGAEDEGLLTVDAYRDTEASAAAISDDVIDAYLVVPEGFGEAVRSNRSSTIQVVGDVDSPTSTRIAAAFAERFATGVASSQTAVAATATVLGVEIDDDFLASLRQDPESAADTFVLDDRSADARQLDATTYFAAGMAVFFLFFTVQFGVAGLLEEERDGTLPRLMAAPIPRSAVIVGKALLAFLLGVISMVVLVAGTTVLMGADWGNPVGVLVLVVSGVLAAVGIMGLVAALARTPEGAGNLGSIIAVILGMLGGSFFPVASGGGVLAVLTYLTPHAWFMRGLADLGSDAPWTEALPAAGAILLFAVATSAIAWVLMKRRWVR